MLVLRLMVRMAIVCLFFLASCSEGPAADLQYIKQASSLAAEWALVNEQANRGKLTGTFINSMHFWLRGSIETASSSLTRPNTRYGNEMRALLAEPPDARPEALRSHANLLKQIEDKLESA